MAEKGKSDPQKSTRQLKLGSLLWRLGERTGISGILNVTPDSFSDGGQFSEAEAAESRGRQMALAGADIIDIGGESTRPGFERVESREEISRVIPVVESLCSIESFPPVSIDTTKLEVARAALESGATIVNDIEGFIGQPAMAELVAEKGASCILMHNSRQGGRSESVLDSIRLSWEVSVQIAKKAGIGEDRIILDPGIGFTDTREQDLTILRGLEALKAFGFPLMIGISKKRVTGLPMNLGLEDRLETTLATSAIGAFLGVDFVRVHDVVENVRAVRMADLIRSS